MEVGSISDAFFHIGFAIQRKVEAGVNLRTLEREVDSCQQLAKSHDHPLLGTVNTVIQAIAHRKLFHQCFCFHFQQHTCTGTRTQFHL